MSEIPLYVYELQGEGKLRGLAPGPFWNGRSDVGKVTPVILCCAAPRLLNLSEGGP